MARQAEPGLFQIANDFTMRLGVPHTIQFDVDENGNPGSRPRLCKFEGGKMRDVSPEFKSPADLLRWVKAYDAGWRACEERAMSTQVDAVVAEKATKVTKSK